MAIGSNRSAVQLSGINVDLHVVLSFVISGFLCGIAGVLLGSRMVIGTPLVGVGAELEAIAAVAIGGASMGGGKGTVWGTIVGVLILSMIANAINLIGLNPFYQDVSRGLVILIALTFRAKENR